MTISMIRSCLHFDAGNKTHNLNTMLNYESLACLRGLSLCLRFVFGDDGASSEVLDGSDAVGSRWCTDTIAVSRPALRAGDSRSY